MIQQLELIPLLDKFIHECEKGHHLQKNGTRLRDGSIQNYKSLRVVLQNFFISNNEPMIIHNLIRCTQKEYLNEMNRWKRVYKKFTNCLYKDCGYHDNYVGNIMKLLRSLLNYLRSQKGIDTRHIRSILHVCKEEIPIVVLNKEQLMYLIHDMEFELSLSRTLRKTKDVFVLGCITGLRVSDLFSLSKKSIEKNRDSWYIKLFSKKTGTFTRILLPDYGKQTTCPENIRTCTR
jgi:site-specific recombinase XerD